MKRALASTLLSVVASCASAARMSDAPLVGFVWPMRGVIAEGVAFDSVTRDFFVSSVHERRIWRVTPDGAFHDFFGPDERMFGAFGMVVDREHGVLWVATSSVPQSGSPSASTNRRAGLLAFDLRDAHLDYSAYFGSESAHVIGDIVLGPDGAVWATDGAEPALYRWNVSGHDGPERVNWGDGWQNPQGLAFDDRGELYVADYSRGIAHVEPFGGSHVLLAGSEEPLRGIDGLYWHDGALFAIQNGTQTHRVLRIELDESRTAIARIETLLEGPPLDDPTHGVFADGAFFVNIASGWGDYTDTGERTTRPLTEHRLVRIELDPKR